MNKNVFTSNSKTLYTEKARLFACASSGFLSSLPFYFDSAYLLKWLSMIPLFCVLLVPYEYAQKKSFRYGFVFHFCRSSAVLLWFRELLSMSAADIPKSLMLLAVCAAIFGISALHGIIFGLAALLSRHLLRSSTRMPLDGILSCLAFTSGEWLLSLGRFGFPWVVTYLTQYRFTVGIQSASLFGGHFISFLIFLCNFFLAYACIGKCKEKRKQLGALAAAVGLFLANCLYGVCVLADSANNAEKANVVTTAIYQDDHSSYEKWSGRPTEVCREFAELFAETYTPDNAPDLILLSETVFTTSLQAENAVVSDTIENTLCRLSDDYGTTIVCGAFAYCDGARYNAQFLVESGAIFENAYYKRTLVPFGEYMPYENTLLTLFPFLEEFNLSGSSLTAGKGAQLVESRYGTLGGLVCYDSIFYQNARESAKNGADMLLLSTNDSWYNDSKAIDQHFAHAVFRAVENRRPLVRCATTGRSGMITSNGTIVAQSEVFEQVILTEDLAFEKASTLSLFTRFGYAWLLFAVAIVTLLRFAVKAYGTKGAAQ